MQSGSLKYLNLCVHTLSPKDFLSSLLGYLYLYFDFFCFSAVHTCTFLLFISHLHPASACISWPLPRCFGRALLNQPVRHIALYPAMRTKSLLSAHRRTVKAQPGSGGALDGSASGLPSNWTDRYIMNPS